MYATQRSFFLNILSNIGFQCLISILSSYGQHSPLYISQRNLSSLYSLSLHDYSINVDTEAERLEILLSAPSAIQVFLEIQGDIRLPILFSA